MSDWRQRAACRDADPEVFFPPTEDDTSAVVAAHLVATRPICEPCPVRVDCLRWALDSGQDYGIWAATTPTGRRQIRRHRAAGLPDPVADLGAGCPGCSLLHATPAVDGEVCPSCQERGAA